MINGEVISFARLDNALSDLGYNRNLETGMHFEKFFLSREIFLRREVIMERLR